LRNIDCDYEKKVKLIVRMEKKHENKIMKTVNNEIIKVIKINSKNNKK